MDENNEKEAGKGPIKKSNRQIVVEVLHRKMVCQNDMLFIQVEQKLELGQFEI